MSDLTDTISTSDDENSGGELARAGTTDLLSSENNCKSLENSPENDQKIKQSDSENSSNDEAAETDSSNQVRPKTVTLKSTDEHKKRLVDMGAVSNQEDTARVVETDLNNTQVKRPFSPKPKSERCYICSKEFLLSSLRIHQKQCAKKLAREKEKQSIQETRNGRKSVTNTQKGGDNFVSKIPRKLKLEACYLCGKEFFAHSLGVHETQCIKNWKADKTPEATEQNVKSNRNLKQSDENPENEDQGKYEKKDLLGGEGTTCNPKVKKSPKDEKKSDEGKQKVLKTLPCAICGVQLLGHSLKVHEKKCRGRKETLEECAGSSEKSSTEYSNKNTNETDILGSGKEKESPVHIAKKPRTIICYICGQEFLKSSYNVHEKQCASKSKAKEESPTHEKDTATVREREPVTQSSPRKPKTQKCFLCGKDMLLSSLKVHEQQCQRKLEILKNINQQSPPVQKPQPNPSRKIGAKPKTEVCYVCGEAFLSSSIKVHEVQCEKKSNTSKKTKS